MQSHVSLKEGDSGRCKLEEAWNRVSPSDAGKNKAPIFDFWPPELLKNYFYCLKPNNGSNFLQ